jgi:hypothetical protein
MIEEIIEAGMQQGIFRKGDTRLRAYAILGMCNWTYKWYKIHSTAYRPEEIADHFIALLESGYLKPGEAGADRRLPEEGVRGPDARMSHEEIRAELRRQSRSLVSLVDQLEE